MTHDYTAVIRLLFRFQMIGSIVRVAASRRCQTGLAGPPAGRVIELGSHHGSLLRLLVQCGAFVFAIESGRGIAAAAENLRRPDIG